MSPDHDKIDPTKVQQLASDGRASVWVAASAGTGKTKVLTDRLLNLLLADTPPSRLLCLTFTKAAAAEMANRLNERLSGWATETDARLRADVAGLIGEAERNVPPEMLDRARRLFARVLDTPGGMRILTIHAFCQSVLRRFPLEAGLPPQFEVMDDRSATELLEEARLGVLTAARAAADDLGAALDEVTRHAGELAFAELMQALTTERGRLAQLIAEAGGLAPYLEHLHRRLGVAPGETEESAVAAACREAAFDGAGLRHATEALNGGSKTDAARGACLAAWLGDPEGRPARFADYAAAFLTAEGEPRKTLATKAVLTADPRIGNVLAAEQARIKRVRDRLAAVVVARASAGLARLAAGFLDAYEAEKRRRGLLDYDDLILATRDLLDRPGIAPWVLFKLDGGIDHILIDEAQDTNPDQWRVVEALAAEFFAGEGAAPPVRTIFAVGDAKQSIFSFQRADPQEFLRMQRHFARRVTEADRLWREVPLQVSFRSTAAVLETVDAVFALDEARAGVALDGALIQHTPFRAGHAGRVELWPALKPDDDEEEEPWAEPVEQRAIEAPRGRLARRIAATIAHWIRTGEPLPARGRPVRAGDVLILVRRRGGFVTELVRELKQAGVPVAGADRMVLTAQLAVMDLVALGRVLLLPDDDLTLASVLKSPLLGLDEDALYRLAHGRDGSLWQALATADEPAMVVARDTLGRLLARADFVPPHRLYAEFLGAGGARRRLIGRLGPEAADAIDEFLAQTLAYERAHVPSLEGFLSWLERGEADIKRDLDQGGRDEVRIMTVHGSKGLQAPIVFLPDTVQAPVQLPPLLWPAGAGLMLWRPAKGAGELMSEAARSAARARRDEEYRRLLYVALTRAEDRLYVAGWRGKRDQAGSWYDLIDAGLAHIGRVEAVAGPPGHEPFPKCWVHDTPQSAPARADTRPTEAALSDEALPDFALRPRPDEPSPPRPLVASRPSEAEPAATSPLGPGNDSRGNDTRRFQRGLLIHRLMQSLPDLTEAAREPAARRFLAQPAHGLDPAEQNAIARETLAVLRHPEFGPLFGPGSRAEVPVVGLVDGRALNGRIDRLVVTAEAVMIVDYKTNRPPPVEAAAVAPAYVEQLAAYRAALALIYPGQRIRTLLLWTDGPRLMEIAPGDGAQGIS
ncbi:double-strand break repair helicase AddA [Aliidongia dinghuensis]|uniref:DNA 3'-5' helicase n=1 Tax=Aliidongia dinghuensis TaxID=1867774 RepID=A0A8J2YVY8_9PROT|nr:double-strand break repair helicase AddA [Aliidongia dinghuensis]GGF28893.1 double-strand break repair helicase AddA [Aliidongia dinghuensis]